MSTEFRLSRGLAGAAVFALAMSSAFAQGFAAMVSPPRFELTAKPGQTQRHALEIMNADLQPATYRIRTADWTLDDKAVVQLSDALAPGSCRPWVAIERREVTVGSGQRYRYRFEVTPPAGATGECRFALAIQGAAETVNAGGNVNIPIAGQIAVIVYVTLDGAAPKLEVVRSAVVERDGQKIPAIYVRNTGDAHGRLDGFLEGADASGRRLDFTPNGLPILPGETREIVLNVATNDASARPVATFPLAIRGNLEWSGNSTPFEARFAP
jgi:hypothetical protein